MLTERHIVIATRPSILLNTPIYQESSDARDTAWWACGVPCYGGTIRGSLAPSPGVPDFLQESAVGEGGSHCQLGQSLRAWSHLQERAAQNMCRWFDPGSAAREAL